MRSVAKGLFVRNPMCSWIAHIMRCGITDYALAAALEYRQYGDIGSTLENE